MADFNVNHITGKQGQQGTVLAGVTTMSSTGSMRIPNGPTEQRGGRGRGVFSGGRNNPVYYSTIEYVEIASTGNTTDFGDLNIQGYGCRGNSNLSRGLFGQTQNNPSQIDYIDISTTGNATDFGDPSSNRYTQGPCSGPES